MAWCDWSPVIGIKRNRNGCRACHCRVDRSHWHLAFSIAGRCWARKAAEIDPVLHVRRVYTLIAGGLLLWLVGHRLKTHCGHCDTITASMVRESGSVLMPQERVMSSNDGCGDVFVCLSDCPRKLSLLSVRAPTLLVRSLTRNKHHDANVSIVDSYNRAVSRLCCDSV